MRYLESWGRFDLLRTSFGWVLRLLYSRLYGVLTSVTSLSVAAFFPRGLILLTSISLNLFSLFFLQSADMVNLLQNRFISQATVRKSGNGHQE